MKKSILFLIAILLSANTIFANDVDPGYAQRVAQNFFQQTTGKSVKMTLAYESVNTKTNNGLAVGAPLYYAFNAVDGKGFVLISASDFVRAVLAYSTEGSFTIQNAPPVVTDWLEKYNYQIAYAKTNLSTTTEAIGYQWLHYYDNVADNTKRITAGNAVGPLVTTAWDQGLYYNAMCPSDAQAPYGFGGRVPTGCGATAMSQIMRYWSYPTQGTGTHSYSSNYGTLSENYTRHAIFNWANMPNSVTSPNNDVATIMAACGVAVEMTYQSNESLSYMIGSAPSCQNAYTTYFGYNPATIQGLQKSSYAESDWLNLIQAELNAGRPIQYAGQGSQGGHTFVLDGSDASGNFHINWGWGGADNGFYGIDGLTPMPQPNGDYSQGEQMIIGIEPLNVTHVTTGIDLYAATTVNPNPVTFAQSFTVNTNIINNGSSAFNGSYCAALFDASGNFIRYIGSILSTGANPLPAGYYYQSGLTFTDTSQGITVPGSYTIGIYYQPTGVNIWTLAGQSTYTNPISITISGPSDAISLYSNITTTPSTFTQGQPGSVNVNLINNGSSTYYGEYEAVLLDLEGNFVEQIGTLNESTGLPATYVYNAPYLTFSTNSITAPEGQYILAIAEMASGTSSWYYCGGQTYQNPVLVAVINSGFMVSVDETSANKLKVYPNPASNNITIEAGELRGDYTLKIYNTVGQLMKESNGTLTGQSLSADVSEYAAGMYVVQLQTEAGTLNSKVVVR